MRWWHGVNDADDAALMALFVGAALFAAWTVFDAYRGMSKCEYRGDE